ncbi:MAG: hypothetical protein Q9160_005713 [Pyrenula sp. 1 TL-2023]
MALGNHENQLFQAELEKFRPHQNRLLSTVHKQSSLLKDLTKTYGDLLQDKRVRADRDKHESITRSRSTVMSKYRKIIGAFEDLTHGLVRAQTFYGDMQDSVESLHKNVEGFVNNRRAEGAQLLNHIEQNKSTNSGSQANAERERLQQLMERMSMEPAPSPSKSQPPALPSAPTNNYSRSPPVSPQYRTTNPDPRFTIPPRASPQPPSAPTPQHQSDYSPQSAAPHDYSHQQHQHQPYPPSAHPFSQGAAAPLSEGYNPMAYPYPSTSPQPYFSPSPAPNPYFQHQPQQIPQPPSQPQPPQRPPSTSQQTQPPAASSPSPYQHLNFRQPSSYGGYQQTPPPPPPNQQPQQPQSQQPYPPQHQNSQYGYMPPPPPPGPPPGQSQPQYPVSAGPWPSGPGGYASAARTTPQAQGQPQSAKPGDPWDGLSGWK